MKDSHVLLKMQDCIIQVFDNVRYNSVIGITATANT